MIDLSEFDLAPIPRRPLPELGPKHHKFLRAMPKGRTTYADLARKLRWDKNTMAGIASALRRHGLIDSTKQRNGNGQVEIWRTKQAAEQEGGQ